MKCAWKTALSENESQVGRTKPDLRGDRSLCGLLPTNVRPKSYNRTVIVPPIEYTSDRALSYCTPHPSTPGPVLYWATLPDCLAPKSGVCLSMAHIRLSTPV